MRATLLLFFLLSFHFSNGQLETRNWFLNQNRISVIPSGVTTGLPLPASGVFPTGYKSTSLSDEAGNLLFASNGNTIIDRNLSVMPALTSINLLGGGGKILIQKIPATNRYYVFYTVRNNFSSVNSSWTVKYAIVDLSLNSGNGDVTIYDQVVETNASPGFSLVQGNDPSVAWLVTHKCATDSFYTFQITNTGLNTSPVKSRAGTNATIGDYIFRDLKTSFDGKMIAGIAYRDYSVFFATTYGLTEVFNFNAVTGTITPKVRTRRTYGYFSTFLSLEFSPDNRLLYTCLSTRVDGLQPCGFGSGTLTQYNLCYTDSIQFEKYSMRIASRFEFCGPTISWANIQMGADKKIHMPYSGVTVSAINKPNRIGSSSNYIFNSYQLPASNFSQVATPEFHHKTMEKAVKNNIVYDGGCHPNPVNFRVTNDTISSIQWNFGDPASATNTSALIAPSHIFSSPGIYTVTAQLYNSQTVLFETITEIVEIKDPTLRLLDGFPMDTALCTGNNLDISLDIVNGIYHWYQLDNNGTIINSTIADSIRISSTSKWYVEMKQNDCNGCTKLDSINVTILPKPNFNLGPNRNLCQGDSIQLIISDPAATYTWSTGATTNSIWVHQGGLYWLEAEYNNNGCPQRDSILITEVPGVNFALPPDITLCNTQTLLLNPGVTNASYLWQNGTTQTTFNVTQAGTYWVKITSVNGCSKSDTITVDYINTTQVYLGNDTILCTGGSLLLQTNIANAQYLWNTGATANQITVTQPGSYWLKVDNGVCTISDTIEVTFNPPPVLFLGNDITLCKNEKLVLNPGINNATYIWQDGSQGNTFTVTQPGTYWLEVKQNSCIVRDSINVTYYNVPNITLGPDTRFCTGDSAVLNAGMGFSSYLWNNGRTTQQISVYTTGNYSVIGTTIDGCRSYDTLSVVNVFPLPVVSLTTDITLCAGASKILDAGAGYTSYLWSNNTVGQTLTVSALGIYTVSVIDNNGCKGSGIANISKTLPSPGKFLFADTAICNYGTIQLKALQSYSQYIWSNGSNSPSIIISDPGIYSLQVTDNNNCIGKDSVIVNLKECLKGLYVPSGFTPNGDGKNDLLKPILLGNIKQYRFKIYNRWGHIVFETTDPLKGWNGILSGQFQDSNVFIWICYYQLEGEAAKTEKGTVVVIR